MRKISGFVIVLTLVNLGAFADEQSEHLVHLRAMMAAMSNHPPVIPQPEAISEQAAKTIAIAARSFSFSPASFAVNQGDVVTLTVTVPAGDASTVGHGILMDTYVEQGLDVGTGQTRSVTFTATTPGTFAFVCTQPSCGDGHTSMIGQMIVNAVSNPGPSVTRVLPNSGSPNGGTTVTISGANFNTTGTTTVKFDTTAATNVNVTSSTSISAVTPAHAEATVSVTVTNPDGQSTTLPNAFTYVTPGPKITAISPTSGSTAGGTAITITGSGFQNGASVKIGAALASNVIVVSSTTITATTPLGPANEQVALPQDVVVTNPDGTSSTLTRAFTYSVPPLAVNSISPTIGVTVGGTLVTITGAGFTTVLNSSVTFGGTAATNVSVVDAITIQATAPPHAAGTVEVVVTVGNNSVSKANAFTYQNPPARHRAARH